MALASTLAKRRRQLRHSQAVGQGNLNQTLVNPIITSKTRAHFNTNSQMKTEVSIEVLIRMSSPTL